MKAAVLKELGTIPEYEEYAEPIASDEKEKIISVHAAALKNIDKFLTTPGHYASYKKVPVVVGIDGVGTLDDGQRVYAAGLTGAFAEKMKIAADSYTPLPGGISYPLAAAIPNAALGSYLPLFVKGKMKKGDTVLVNGGTGITGKLAIQLAKIRGAGRVILMGRTEGREDDLKALGVDDLISLQQNDEAIIKTLVSINRETPITLVLDYLWGHPAELILGSLKGEKGSFSELPAQLISIGSLAGDGIRLSSNILRGSKITVTGAGLGSYTKEEFGKFYKQELIDVFQLAADGKIRLDIQQEKLEDIKTVWTRKVKDKRIVLTM